ncbi:uncharacterized protein MELLADRAFT_111603 [Melampsora larici-populina 98AG31]|uniref:Uncharacterized protein n=1 Tax=Melampsora larici-populina (strain 98AG31 / pathotype 3-4-7) TaxID=747676 RepID=F4S3R1_MELLP|nr:uncharacterized protein MELLADRAFT_111603 [Melampsora larici-populina 98AG31]EGG00718.1 hypothetical protein MELLADRAFT_111603 [Melampsora larici-populina 98AG31]
MGGIKPSGTSVRKIVTRPVAFGLVSYLPIWQSGAVTNDIIALSQYALNMQQECLIHCCERVQFMTKMSYDSTTQCSHRPLSNTRPVITLGIFTKTTLRRQLGLSNISVTCGGIAVWALRCALACVDRFVASIEKINATQNTIRLLDGKLHFIK